MNSFYETRDGVGFPAALLVEYGSPQTWILDGTGSQILNGTILYQQFRFSKRKALRDDKGETF